MNKHKTTNTKHATQTKHKPQTLGNKHIARKQTKQ